MTTSVVVRKNNQIAIAADSLVTFGETRLGQGREASKEFLKGNKDIATEIDRRIRAKMADIALPVEGIEEAE